jgi:hypothetical protein
MRRKYLVLVYFVACCGLLWFSGCQKQVRSEAEPAALSTVAVAWEQHSGGELPRIAFSKLGHDFGEVSPNKLYRADIKFTNTGEDTLKITKVSRCCGVVARLADGKEEYAPGESGAVHLEWRSGPKPMVFTRELVVHSNDKASPATKLKIQATVGLKVTWEPSRLRLALNEVNAGGQNITIRCLDGRPFLITSFKSTNDCITADFDPSVEATKFVLEPKINTEKLQKNLKGSITISLTHPDGNTVVVPFDVLPKYTINPSLLIVFNAEPDKPIVRKISVLNNYRKDFAVDSLSSKSGIVGAKILNKKKTTNGHQLEVELMPPASDGKPRVLDEFYLTLEDGEKLPIKCNVYYKKTRPATTTK